MQRFQEKTGSGHKTAGNYILRNVRRWMRMFNLRQSGNYSIDELRPLLDHFNLSLRIFSKHVGNRQTTCIPKQFDRNRIIINAFAVKTLGYNHLHFIKKLGTLFKNAPCHFCGQLVSSEKRHFCPNSGNCS